MTDTFHICVAMKPLDGNFVQNAIEHEVAGLNIDGCRIETEEKLGGGAYAKDGKERHDGAENWRYKRDGGAGEFQQPPGRWPANVIHDGSDGVVELFPETKSGTRNGKRKAHDEFGTFTDRERDSGYHKQGDSGSAARFFKECKLDGEER